MNTQIMIAICVLLVIVLAGVGAAVYFLKNTSDNPTPQKTPTSTPVSTPVSTPSTLAPFSSSTSLQNTPWNDDGSGNALFLDRHNVNCDTNGINELYLKRDGDKKIRYEYRCSSGGKLQTPTAHTTTLTPDGDGNANFLDRQNVDCGSNNVLTQLGLSRGADKKTYQYNFKCAPSTNNLTCRQASTPWNDEGAGKSTYLDRHDIKCNSDEAISQLHLVRKGDGNYHYEYTCCKT